MTRSHIATTVTALFLACTVQAPAQEPSGVKGYITWTDPASGKKHIVMGEDLLTGATRFYSDYPKIQVHFTGMSWMGVEVTASDSYFVPVDATGRELPHGMVNWRGANIPVAFRYNIAFRHNLGYAGAPMLLNDHKTILYNPSRNQFTDISVRATFAGLKWWPEDWPGKWEGGRPVIMRRPSPFNDLPAF